MIKLETKKMQNAIAKAKAVHPKVVRVDAGEYKVQGHENTYVVTLGKANGLYLGECTCPARTVCYHIAAACSLHIAIKSGYRKQQDERATAILVKHGKNGVRMSDSPIMV